MELQADVIGVTGNLAIRKDENMMNPVIGLDISKGQIEGQAFLKRQVSRKAPIARFYKLSNLHMVLHWKSRLFI
ncbi:hypothetical protein HGO21_03465 [Acinetobacter sp. CUI P1]|nr:hypothetical protein [Acinetobacter sp. CUI P1]